MAPTLTLQTVISARDDLLSSDLSESEMVMMNIDKGFYYGLEDVGKLIWDALGEPRSIDALCDLVLARYAEERATIEEHVLTFAQDLLEEELVSIHAES